MTFSKQLPWQDIWLLQNSNSVWATKRSVNGLVDITIYYFGLGCIANKGSGENEFLLPLQLKYLLSEYQNLWSVASTQGELVIGKKALISTFQQLKSCFQFCIFAFMWSVLMIKQHFIISWIHWTCFANWQKQPSSWNDICIKCCTLCCGWTDICTMCVLKNCNTASDLLELGYKLEFALGIRNRIPTKIQCRVPITKCEQIFVSN